MKLTFKNFIKARDYLYAYSDDINRAQFRYNFENNDSDTFMDVLAKYQHENGVFDGLVYEWEYNGPILKDTEHAFRYIFYLKDKPSAGHQVIKKMMKYLHDRYCPDIGHRGSMDEPGVNDGAHVPWRKYNEDEYPPITDENERF